MQNAAEPEVLALQFDKDMGIAHQVLVAQFFLIFYEILALGI